MACIFIDPWFEGAGGGLEEEEEAEHVTPLGLIEQWLSSPQAGAFENTVQRRLCRGFGLLRRASASGLVW